MQRITNNGNQSAAWLLMAALCLFGAATLPASADEPQKEYVGAKECFSCHKDRKRSYLESAHGKAWSNNPQGELQQIGCEACHGSGTEHVKIAGEQGTRTSWGIENFRKKDQENSSAACLQCHMGGDRMHWSGSQHDMAKMNCADCHTIHTSGPTVTAEVCGNCHVEQRAKMQRSMHMPQREGKMSCLSCHNPHGGIGPNNLKTATVNETCYDCHAEKRGPMLWEHAPVRENCANCHDPHGSNNPASTKLRLPYLCQQCHSFARHPSDVYDQGDIDPATVNRRVVGRGCINCHSNIHGSNHPSGQRFAR